MAAYYNEIDPYAAQWLRNLIKEGLIADSDNDLGPDCETHAIDHDIAADEIRLRIMKR